MTEKKAYPLRISADVLNAAQRWANDDLRSLNAQIEAAGNDYTVLAGLSSELGDVAAERDMLELEWLEAAELLS